MRGDRDEGKVEDATVEGEVEKADAELGADDEGSGKSRSCWTEVEVRSRPARESMMSSAATESEGIPIIMRSPVSALCGGMDRAPSPGDTGVDGCC